MKTSIFCTVWVTCACGSSLTTGSSSSVCARGRACGQMVEIVYRQVNVDMSFVDWEKSRGMVGPCGSSASIRPRYCILWHSVLLLLLLVLLLWLLLLVLLWLLLLVLLWLLLSLLLVAIYLTSTSERVS